MSLDFNPNQPAKRKEFFWATYFPDRNPKFKMYSQRGHALSSFQYRDEGILYKWDESRSEWREIYRLEKRSTALTHCEKCGNEIPLNKWGSRYTYHRWYFTDTDSPQYLTICSVCWHEKRNKK